MSTLKHDLPQQQSAPRRGSGFLRTPEQWGDAALASVGGYAAALAIWQARHVPDLTAFVFRNELPLDARRDLVTWLLAGAGAGLVAWFLLGYVLARRAARPRARTLAARVLFLATPLAFVPVLAIPDLATSAPFFALACLAGAVATAALAVWLVARPPATGAAHVVGDDRADRPGDAVSGAAASRWGLAAAGGLALAYALFMSLLSLARHDAYLTNAFDLGIHDQALYNILHSGYMRATLYGPYAIDYIGDHFSPILFLLAPIYALRQDARTLLVLQSFFLAAGAVPLYQIARLKTRSVALALSLVAAYLLHPALHGTNLDDFHQIALVIVFLLAALYFLETERDVPFLIALALSLIVKEEVALTVAAVGAYAFLGKRRYRLGAGVAAAALAYFVVVVGWAMPALGGTPQIDTRFETLIAPGASGATGAVLTLLTNPWYTAVLAFGDHGKVLYLLQTFLPVLFLPLLAPRTAWLVALPALAVALLTDTPAQYDINYHYSAHLLPAMFFLAALALGRIVSSRPGSTRVLAAALIVASAGMTYLYGQAGLVGDAAWPRQDAHDRVVDRFVAEVPAEASVSTLGGIVPHLTARKTIYLFPDVADAEYLLLDTALSANYWPFEGLKARDQSIASMLPHVTSGEFGLVRSEDGVFFFRRGHDAAGNDAALRQLLSTRYEAEELRSDFDASIVTDGEASGGRARMVGPAGIREDGKAALVYGPYTDLQPGNYRATFVMKATAAGQDATVATIDVFSHRDGYPRAAQEVKGGDWQTPGAYRSFPLVFNTSGQVLQDVELRVLYGGAGELSLDRVELEYLRP